MIVPPHANAVPSRAAEMASTQRDHHVRSINEQGHMCWQATSGHTWRALVEADVSRFKRVVGDALCSRTERRRATEVAITVGVLNRMMDLGRPEYVRTA